MKGGYALSYLPRAKSDLETIFDYICRDAPSRAPAFLKKIDRTVQRLKSFPLSGAMPKDGLLKKKGYRFLTIENYLVFYRVEKKAVWIYRVLRGKRRYELIL